MRLVLAGGGTGGHVYPILSVLGVLRERTAKPEVMYLGSRGGVEEGLSARAGIPFYPIPAAPARGRSPLRLLLNLLKNGTGVYQSLKTMKDDKPDVVLATGGYASVPVILAAWLLRVPSLVYLPDAYPGWAVRFLAAFASAVAVTSKEAADHLRAKNVAVTGYPVRREFFTLAKSVARAKLSIGPSAKVLLVMGGSQGAHSINQKISEGLQELLQLAEVVHISGESDLQRLLARKQGLPAEVAGRYHLYGYLHEELPAAMVSADLVLCRSGASVLGELPAAGVAAVLVPYPHAGGHQRLNARALTEAGAAITIEESKIEELLPTVKALLEDDSLRIKMQNNCRSLATPDAADKIASLLERLVEEKRELRLHCAG